MLMRIAPRSIRGDPRKAAEDYVEDQINKKIDEIDKIADCGKIGKAQAAIKNAAGALGLSRFRQVDWVSFKEQIESSAQAQEQEQFIGDLLSKTLGFLNDMKSGFEKQRDNLFAELRKVQSWI